MPDDKRKRGRADRAKVAGLQPYEINRVAKRFGVTPRRVKAVLQAVGHSRRKVYAELRRWP